MRLPAAVPGSRIIFAGVLATLMVPFQVVMIPTLLIVKHLHIVDSLPALSCQPRHPIWYLPASAFL